MLTVVVTAWWGVSALLLVAGFWLLLAGRLNARHRNGNRVGGIALAVRVALVAAWWPIVVLTCVIGGVRTRLRDSTRRLVAARRDAAVVTDVESHHQRERNARAMNTDPRGRVDYGVPQTAPFWVGQRIRNIHAGRGVVISAQASDIADPRGCCPAAAGGRSSSNSTRAALASAFRRPCWNVWIAKPSHVLNPCTGGNVIAKHDE